MASFTSSRRNYAHAIMGSCGWTLSVWITCNVHYIIRIVRFVTKRILSQILVKHVIN